MSVKEFPELQARLTEEQMLRTGFHADVRCQQLRSDITVLSGSGANIEALDDPDGKVLVDSGLTVSKPEVEASLSRISRRQVSFLVNTHFHFDHTDGNEWLHGLGATIISHTQTRLRLSLSQTIPAFRSVRPALPAAALPTITFDRQMRLHLRNEKRFTQEVYACTY